jgi:hypothetical protein
LTVVKELKQIWKMGNWGEINRFQRLSGAINLKYDDTYQARRLVLDLRFGVLASLRVKNDTKKNVWL